MKSYSRLNLTEERKNMKKAYWYVFLSILALIFLVFLGLPTLVKFAGFIGEIAKSDKAIEIKDITPPAPPQFDELPDYTNNDVLRIGGKSENGATIVIRANNRDSEVVANSDGIFNFVFNLDKGENSIDAKAKDLSNNESTQTQTYKIVYDNEEPKLEISNPSDGASFFGNNQRQLSITGTLDEIVNLTINGRKVTLKDDNSFTFTTTLNEGENKFDIIAMDPSGNETLTSLTVNFSL